MYFDSIFWTILEILNSKLDREQQITDNERKKNWHSLTDRYKNKVENVEVCFSAYIGVEQIKKVTVGVAVQLNKWKNCIQPFE